MWRASLAALLQGAEYTFENVEVQLSLKPKKSSTQISSEPDMSQQKPS